MDKTIEAKHWRHDLPLEDLRIAVSRAELDARRDKVLAGMAAERIDALVLTTPLSIYYLTGIGLGGLPPLAFALAASGAHRFMLRLIDLKWRDVWADQTWATEWLAFRDEDDTDEVIGRAIREIHPRGISRLGMELNRPSASYQTVRRVTELSGALDVVSATHLVEDQRVVKSEAEQAIIRRAGLLANRATDTIIATIAAGGTDVEAAMAAAALTVKEGHGGHPPHYPYVFAGPSGETGHLPWARVAPKPGEVVTWFVKGFIHKYGCPIERTLIKGPDTQKVGAMIESVARTVERVAAALRPGMTSDEAYRVAYRSHEEAGFAKYFPNHAAYSFGLHSAEFELFRLRANDTRVLRAGMTFHLVPCLIVPGIGNICASRPVVVTESGGAPLNDYPLRLAVV
ncbi:MAG: Xaa-Pro dipeptidase [Chloroflexota bacterium]|nr:Xaa-Pro dipeptidase [Chloroflexota bacterium]